jgi:hypothetical protein
MSWTPIAQPSQAILTSLFRAGWTRGLNGAHLYQYMSPASNTRYLMVLGKNFEPVGFFQASSMAQLGRGGSHSGASTTANQDGPVQREGVGSDPDEPVIARSPGSPFRTPPSRPPVGGRVFTPPSRNPVVTLRGIPMKSAIGRFTGQSSRYQWSSLVAASWQQVSQPAAAVVTCCFQATALRYPTVAGLAVQGAVAYRECVGSDGYLYAMPQAANGNILGWYRIAYSGPHAAAPYPVIMAQAIVKQQQPSHNTGNTSDHAGRRLLSGAVSLHQLYPGYGPILGEEPEGPAHSGGEPPSTPSFPGGGEEPEGPAHNGGPMPSGPTQGGGRLAPVSQVVRRVFMGSNAIGFGQEGGVSDPDGPAPNNPLGGGDPNTGDPSPDPSSGGADPGTGTPAAPPEGQNPFGGDGPSDPSSNPPGGGGGGSSSPTSPSSNNPSTSPTGPSSSNSSSSALATSSGLPTWAYWLIGLAVAAGVVAVGWMLYKHKKGGGAHAKHAGKHKVGKHASGKHSVRRSGIHRVRRAGRRR